MSPFQKAWDLLKASEDQRLRESGHFDNQTYQQTVHPAIRAYTQRHLGMSPGMASVLGQLEMGKTPDTIHDNITYAPMPTIGEQLTREEGTPHESLQLAMRKPMVSQDMGDLPEEYYSTRPRIPEEVVDPMFIAQDRHPLARQHPKAHFVNLDDSRSREFRERLAESRGQ